MNKNQRKHYDELASLGCVLCLHLGKGKSPAEIHHIRRFGGKRDNAPTIPLCPEHHRGNSGIHGLGAKGFEKRYGFDQEFLLALSTELINRQRSFQSEGNPQDF